MKLVIQYVSKAKVTVQNKEVGRIKTGYVVLVGIGHSDTKESVEKACQKLLKLRIIPDDQGKLNYSIQDIRGDILLISQFTLYGHSSGGNRPGFQEAAPKQISQPLFDHLTWLLKQTPLTIETGIFGADMTVSLSNSGPITYILET